MLGQFRSVEIQAREACSKLITFTRLEQPLSNNLYAIFASRTEFQAYQFKPVLKFLGSPNGRLLIADEVGLGKTIEAGLIMIEDRARHGLDRILVVCPSALCEKWRVEMRNRFDEEFTVLDAAGVRRFLEDSAQYEEGVRLRGICSLQTLRGRGLNLSDDLRGRSKTVRRDHRTSLRQCRGAKIVAIGPIEYYSHAWTGVVFEPLELHRRVYQRGTSAFANRAARVRVPIFPKPLVERLIFRVRNNLLHFTNHGSPLCVDPVIWKASLTHNCLDAFECITAKTTVILEQLFGDSGHFIRC